MIFLNQSELRKYKHPKSKTLLEVQFYVQSFLIPNIILKIPLSALGLLKTTTFISRPPIQYRQKQIPAIIRIAEIITNASLNGNNAAVKRPAANAMQIIPLELRINK